MSSTETIDTAAATARRQWLKDRRKGIGASEAAALFGQHPFMSMFSLWESKTSDAEISDEENDRMQDGLIMEPRIAARYQGKTKRVIRKPELRTFQHPDHPLMMATPDGIVEFSDIESGPLELKWWDHYRADDEIPAYGLIQLQQQMAVLGAQRGSMGILGSYRSFHHADMVRNDRFIAILIEKIEEFWDLVKRGTPPEADGSHATAEALKRLYKDDSGETVALSEEALQWRDDLSSAKEAIKDGTAREALAKNRIKRVMGNATYATLPDGSGFSLKSQTKEAYVVEEQTFRVLRTIKRKGEK